MCTHSVLLASKTPSFVLFVTWNFLITYISYQRTKTISRPYFRDWSRLNIDSGKTFFAPPTIFKGAAAQYFPNLRGYTLENTSSANKDTTDVLKGRVSLVSAFSGLWAERQVRSWAEGNDGLRELLSSTKEAPPRRDGDKDGGMQTIDINIEPTRLRAALVYLFTRNLRSQRPALEWSRYFIVRRGVTQDIRDAMGYVNGKAGYVALVDSECRIRWAGCGEATVEEKGRLVKAAKRLLSLERNKENEKTPEASRGKPAQVVEGVVTKTKRPVAAAAASNPQLAVH